MQVKAIVNPFIIMLQKSLLCLFTIGVKETKRNTTSKIASIKTLFWSPCTLTWEISYT